MTTEINDCKETKETKQEEIEMCSVINIDNKKDFVMYLENKLDIDIGYYFWKKYVASAFWSNISTPINLIITLLTAITTAHTTSSNIISEDTSIKLGVITLVITAMNTFFRPHTKMSQSIELMKKWIELGNDFEETYYSQHKYNTDADIIIKTYKEYQVRSNQLKESEGPETMNFLTDIIHIISNKFCLRKYQKWLDTNKEIMRDSRILNREEKLEEIKEIKTSKKWWCWN
jgi:ABC-type multidrug transport system fused ATPase/permease subunit